MNLERIGRSRLKLRLPALRAMIDAQQTPAFCALCEEYAIVGMARGQLGATVEYKPAELSDLEIVSVEIERDVDRLLHTPNVKQLRS
ncbi:hypothetical protein LPJGGPFB_04000 [Ensifer adhaerens]|uniref:Uncharacterized protein n=1 Tax=Ensifer adhaerens TaxID=106592 RepID=A0ACC5T2X9_ENSAD|nr:hypothetical protein [Ensifer adhaerens]MBP1875462.1 hypothetical protein [Ensifer adhaerens]NRP20741.1 hypothetical protein [Ensifer adhaerens]